MAVPPPEPPEIELASPSPQARRLKAPLMVAAAFAVGLLGFIGFGGWQGSGGDMPPPPAVVAEMQAEWSAASATGFQLARVAPADQTAAIQGLPLSDQDKALVKADLDAGRTQLVQVEVWDSMDEDGDTVELSSEGVRHVVVLRNAHTVVSLPMPRDGIVRLRGVRDGAGGGITVGILSGGTRVRIPPMKPGQELNLPVR